MLILLAVSGLSPLAAPVTGRGGGYVETDLAVNKLVDNVPTLTDRVPLDESPGEDGVMKSALVPTPSTSRQT